MAKRLREHLNSSYVEASNIFYPNKRQKYIVVYVESYDDVPFWRTILEEAAGEDINFRVMLPSNKTLSKGKKTVLFSSIHSNAFGKNLIACVDSDYDYLMQNATPTSKLINESPYIFQTYAYAIENYRCYAKNLYEVCVRATLNDNPIFDFEYFLQRYSEIIYPLFLCNLWFYRNGDTHSYPMYAFHNDTALQAFSVREPEACLERLAKRVNHALEQLKNQHPNLQADTKKLGGELVNLGLTPENSYLFIQGHHLVENVVSRLLEPVCRILRHQRERQIAALAEHDKQYKNEMSGYNNSSTPVDILLKKSDVYKKPPLYDKLRADLAVLIEMLKQQSPGKETEKVVREGAQSANKELIAPHTGRAEKE